jgi:hypothetical protein
MVAATELADSLEINNPIALLDIAKTMADCLIT